MGVHKMESDYRKREVNRLVQVQGYRFFAIDLPKDGC